MAKKKQIENKDLMELGTRSRAGRMLSEYMRGIGSERTEKVINPISCRPEIVSKAEALVRRLWDKAMGRRMKINIETGEMEIIDGEIDLDCVKILLERIEGKAGVVDGDGGVGQPTAAEKVSEINKKRINQMAEGDGE